MRLGGSPGFPGKNANRRRAGRRFLRLKPGESGRFPLRIPLFIANAAFLAKRVAIPLWRPAP
jgi:hypothetical protein